MSEPLQIRSLHAEDLDELAPLWAALYDHHMAVAPQITEVSVVVGPAESWRRRRALYERWLAEPDAFLLCAARRGRLLGYAVARLATAEEGTTWELDGRIGVVETLSVSPAARGEGVGSALIRTVKERLCAGGVSSLELNVVATNDDAIRFYQRHGLRPTVTRMMGRLDSGG